MSGDQVKNLRGVTRQEGRTDSMYLGEDPPQRGLQLLGLEGLGATERIECVALLAERHRLLGIGRAVGHEADKLPASHIHGSPIVVGEDRTIDMPGAYDNASGVAAVLSAAEDLAAKPPE